MNFARYTYNYAFDRGLNLLQRTASLSQTRIIVGPHTNRAINSELYHSLKLAPSKRAMLNNALIDEGIFDRAGNQLKSVINATLVWDYRSMLQNTVTPLSSDKGAITGEVKEYNLYAKTGRRNRKITERTDATGNILEIQEALYLGNLEYRSTWKGGDLNYDGEVVRENNESQTPQEAYIALRIRQGHKQVSEKRVYLYKDGEAVSETAAFFSLDNNIDSCELQLNDQGKLESYYASKPYGETAVSYSKAKQHPYKYSGQEKDQSGLYYYGYRSLLPQNSRWMSADPAGLKGSGLNWYAMVNGNPVTQKDMYGLGLLSLLLSLATAVSSPNTSIGQIDAYVEHDDYDIIGYGERYKKLEFYRSDDDVNIGKQDDQSLGGILMFYSIYIDKNTIDDQHALTLIECLKISEPLKDEGVPKWDFFKLGSKVIRSPRSPEYGYYAHEIPLDKIYDYSDTHFVMMGRDQYSIPAVPLNNSHASANASSHSQWRYAGKIDQTYWLYRGKFKNNSDYDEYFDYKNKNQLVKVKGSNIRILQYVEKGNKMFEAVKRSDENKNTVQAIELKADLIDFAGKGQKNKAVVDFKKGFPRTRSEFNNELARKKGLPRLTETFRPSPGKVSRSVAIPALPTIPEKEEL